MSAPVLEVDQPVSSTYEIIRRVGAGSKGGKTRLTNIMPTVAAALLVLSMPACNVLLGIHAHSGPPADASPSSPDSLGDAASGSLGVDAGDAGAAGGAGTGPAFLLDDFEDLDAVPADPRFAEWQFYAYNDPLASVSSRPYGPGYESNGAINLIWRVHDAPDGTNNSAGAGLRTLVAASSVYVDLSKYQRMVFSHRYVNDGTCESIAQFSVNIGCGEKSSAFTHLVPVSVAAWQTTTIDLSSLIVNAYPPPNGTALSDCLAVADNVYFDVQRPLEDGHCASGELDLDNISFR